MRRSCIVDDRLIDLYFHDLVSLTNIRKDRLMLYNPILFFTSIKELMDTSGLLSLVPPLSDGPRGTLPYIPA